MEKKDAEEANAGKDQVGECQGVVATDQTQPRRKKRAGTRRRVKVFPEIREAGVTQETPEQTALRRLRSRLRLCSSHPVYQGVECLSDTDLLGWLRSFDLNVYMAEAKLRQHFQTRKRLGLDDILRDYTPPAALTNHCTGGLCGQDRDKRPVWYELPGRLDMNRLVKSVPLDQLVKFKFFQLEGLRLKVKESEASQILVVVDMEEMTHHSLGAALDIWRHYISILQDHYPYLVHEMLILRPPVIHTEFALALRPYINRQTWAKVTVIRSKVLKYLLTRMEKFQLPACYGGYKCDADGDPSCRQNLCWDGKIPQWMYLSDPRRCANVHKMLVLGGQRLVQESHVATPGSHVIWEFYDLSHPLVFSVYLNRVEEGSCVIKESLLDLASPSKRVIGVVSGAAGRYFSVFNNCKNLARPASGLYTISVVPPDWLTAKLSTKTPLGDRFDMRKPMGSNERKVIEANLPRAPNNTWKKAMAP